MDARKLQDLRNLGNECEEAADEIDRLTRELAEARETLQFVERWANHHGVNPRTTTAEALGVIQHHPAILEITDSYVDGKRPTTRNPYAELAEAKARIAELEADAEIGKRWRENSSLEEWFPITAEEIDRLRAEVEDWRKLLDPANLHVNLLQGKPAKLTRAQLTHLLGQDYTALLAELEALRAASVIEWEPGRSYTAAELLRRAIQGLRVRKDHDLWPAVRNMCGVGSTVAHYLCRWAGRDPDTGKDIAARKGEGVEGA